MHPTSSAEHRRVREQIGCYALGQLPQPERLAFQAHLDGCPSCQDELDSLRPAVEALSKVDVDRAARRLRSEPTPPPELGETIMRRIEAERQLPRLEPGRRRRVPKAATLTVAAAAVAGLAFGGGFLTARPDPIPLETVALQNAAPGVSANAGVVPHTWGMEVKLNGTGFAKGQAYKVTVLDREGRRVSAGEFVGTGPNEMKCNLNSSVLRANAARFTVTDASGNEVLSSALA